MQKRLAFGLLHKKEPKGDDYLGYTIIHLETVPAEVSPIRFPDRRGSRRTLSCCREIPAATCQGAFVFGALCES